MKINLNTIKKWLRYVSVFGLSILLFIVLTNAYILFSTQSSIFAFDEFENAQSDETIKFDAILVLGAGVNPDGNPSLMLRDRLDMAIKIYDAQLAPKLLMSGDHGNVSYDEVNVMKSYARTANVPSSDVFMDHAGFSTYESIYRAKAVFEANALIIVTQRYHLPRAVFIAKSLGIEAVGIAADDIRYSGQTMRAAREVLARVKDTGSTIFKPLPTYLGDVIPISGDGDQTND